MIQPGSAGYKVGIALEKFLYSKAWLVTGQSKTILANITGRFPRINAYHLSNGVNVAQFTPVENCQPVEKLRVVYAGLHGLAQGLEQILAAVALLGDVNPFEVLFIGDGPEKQRLIETGRIVRVG
jgi:glycosyltransferase involved in cell wall biosynthesis